MRIMIAIALLALSTIFSHSETLTCTVTKDSHKHGRPGHHAQVVKDAQGNIFCAINMLIIGVGKDGAAGGGGPGIPTINDATFALSLPAATNTEVGRVTAADVVDTCAITAQSAANYTIAKASTNQCVVRVSAAGSTNLTTSGTDTITIRATNVTGNDSATITINRTAPVTGDPNDGFANAPAGVAAQYPNLLDGYAARPPWRVAGVDYGVGPPAATVFKIPSTSNHPACVCVGGSCPGPGIRKGNTTFEVTTDNCVIDGWDFTGDGGWIVEVMGSNPVITNNKFLGEDKVLILDFSNGKGATFNYNHVNFNFGNESFNNGVKFNRGGVFEIKYNWFQNALCDFAGAGADPVSSGLSTTYDVRFNLWDQNAQHDESQDCHGDYFQTFSQDGGAGDTVKHYNAMTFKYNTWRHTTIPCFVDPIACGTDGVVLDGNDHYVTGVTMFDNTTFDNNTGVLTAEPNGVRGRINYWIVMQKRSTLIGEVKNNYVDARATNDAFRISDNGSGQITFSGNINMQTGGACNANGNPC